MTGFSSKEFSIDSLNLSVEIKSYNHKYLDIYIKLPKYLNFLEASIRKEVSESLKRGRVEVFVNVQESGLTNPIDMNKFSDTLELIKTLKKNFKIKGDVSIEEVFLLKEYFMGGAENYYFDKEFQEKFLTLFKALLKNFIKTRADEGKIIQKDVLKRLTFIENKIKELKKQLPAIKQKQKEKIKKKFEEIFKIGVDKNRLEQEIVYLLDKTDVTEEITRLEGHFKNFKKISKNDDAIGKKLDFYLQEIFRELNTLSVKSQDYNISELIIDLKTETEKIRELIQNVE